MVAAVPLTTVSHTNQKKVTSNDLRNIAVGLAAAIALILVASQIAASDSASVSATALEDAPEKRFAAGFDSVAATDGTYGIGDALTITATWDSAVSVTGVPTLVLSNGDSATYFSGSGSVTLSFITTVADGDSDSSDLSVSSYSGTITADNDGSNAGAASGDLGSVVIDGDTPDITGCDATDGTYKIGDDIDITCTFDEAVDITGTPQITLSNNDVVDYSSGTGNAAIVFTYTVGSGDTDSTDLSVSSIAANGGTIQDDADNDFATAITGGDLGAVVVDANVPAFASVAATDGAYGVGETLTITVTWGEAVVVTGTPTLTLSNNDVASYTSGSASTALVFTTTVAENDGTSADLSVSSFSGTIADAAGNAAAAASGDLGAVTIDGDAPDFVSVAANDAAYGVGESITITVTWDEAVSVTGTPTLVLDNGESASYTSGTGNAALVFTYTVGEGDTDSSDLAVSSFSGTIADAAGGAAGAASGDLGTVTVDGDAPDFTSCAATDAAYGVGETLSITCTWDEAVVTADGTLTLSNNDVAAYSSGSGSTSIEPADKGVAA